MRIIHKITFYYCGTFFDEDSTRVVKTRNPGNVVVPKHAFAFEFFDIVKQNATLEDGRVIEHSERKNSGPMYYPGAKIMTANDVKQEIADNKILLYNMECNGWEKVIKTRMGNFKPYVTGKTVVI